jgi:ribonuclease R/exosome complex exonuclease DIS3/RRP44
MEDKIDQYFEGVISGVTDRGIYVEIIENKCEGMVKISEIKGDYFVYDEKTHSLVGERTSKVYQLGDPVGVIVKKSGSNEKTIGFYYRGTNRIIS